MKLIVIFQHFNAFFRSMDKTVNSNNYENPFEEHVDKIDGNKMNKFKKIKLQLLTIVKRPGLACP